MHVLIICGCEKTKIEPLIELFPVVSRFNMYARKLILPMKVSASTGRCYHIPQKLIFSPFSNLTIQKRRDAGSEKMQKPGNLSFALKAPRPNSEMDCAHLRLKQTQ